MHETSIPVTQLPPPTGTPRARRAPTTRSRYANNPRLVPGVKLNTAAGRRLHCLMEDLAQQFGGLDRLDAEGIDAVVQVAALTIAVETTRAKIVNDESPDMALFVKLSGELRRQRRALAERAKAKSSADADPLGTYLAAKAAKVADNADGESAEAEALS